MISLSKAWKPVVAVGVFGVTLVLQSCAGSEIRHRADEVTGGRVTGAIDGAAKLSEKAKKATAGVVSKFKDSESKFEQANRLVSGGSQIEKEVMQRILSEKGYMVQEDVIGTWGPKSTAALESAMKHSPNFAFTMTEGASGVIEGAKTGLVDKPVAPGAKPADPRVK